MRTQKLLLSWLIAYPSLYSAVREYIGPEDFTEEPCRTVAQLLFHQYEVGENMPARIINHFEDPEEQREVAALFHASVPASSEEGREKAFKEALQKMVFLSLDTRRAALDPADISGLQDLIARQKAARAIQNRAFVF